MGKVTPSNGITWWLKWLGSLSGMSAALLTALELHPFNMIMGLICFVSWSIVGMMWHDRALIVMNIFLLGAYVMTLLEHIKQWIQ